MLLNLWTVSRMICLAQSPIIGVPVSGIIYLHIPENICKLAHMFEVLNLARCAKSARKRA